MTSKRKLRARIAELEIARRAPRNPSFLSLDLHFAGAYFGLPTTITVPLDVEVLLTDGRRQIRLPYLIVSQDMGPYLTQVIPSVQREATAE